MTEISPGFSQTGAPVLNVDDAGGAAISQLIPRSQLVSVTPKALSKATYLKDFHTAISNFLETFL